MLEILFWRMPCCTGMKVGYRFLTNKQQTVHSDNFFSFELLVRKRCKIQNWSFQLAWKSWAFPGDLEQVFKGDLATALAWRVFSSNGALSSLRWLNRHYLSRCSTSRNSSASFTGHLQSPAITFWNIRFPLKWPTSDRKRAQGAKWTSATRAVASESEDSLLDKLYEDLELRTSASNTDERDRLELVTVHTIRMHRVWGCLILN